jgi:hypothetical protein
MALQTQWLNNGANYEREKSMMSDMGLSEMYEAKIEHLEMQNENLQLQIVELKADLIQMLSGFSLISKVIRACTEEGEDDYTPEA